MKEILKDLEGLGFYSYENSTLVPIIQALQLNNNSIWLRDGKYKRLNTLDITSFPEAEELMDNEPDEDDNFLYLYRPLPPHRCFTLDKEDLYEYPPMIFEDIYLCNSLSRCGVIIEDVDEYEDSEGNSHLITNVCDFLICPYEFRTSYTQNYLKWRVVTARILLMLNLILSQADSDARFYLLSEEGKEGDTIVVLINPPIFKFFQYISELENQDLPKPIEKYFESILF
ncbi:MAG: hypothetical protein RMY64_06760 [Nostoc sp. DedQUE08]|uniref:hypothetical protein n=1 Tax=unclassified Nostoc TaxID=2593658 RepID=UPI002AD20408|nr:MULTISPECIES: hypothetical protein [unclassified Nostoc]MDZ8065327.1 hypothetical protein [Nostoc sp. DedQUE08]MDZ8091929.1 hypothetical protein [Nostoc sp. DedQUE05]